MNHESSRSAALNATSLITIAVCVLLSGCGPKTIWSAEARSRDGHWVTSARTDQYSGPGNPGLYTTVELRRTSGQKSPMEILLLPSRVPVRGKCEDDLVNSIASGDGVQHTREYRLPSRQVRQNRHLRARASK